MIRRTILAALAVVLFQKPEPRPEPRKLVVSSGVVTLDLDALKTTQVALTNGPAWAEHFDGTAVAY